MEEKNVQTLTDNELNNVAYNMVIANSLIEAQHNLVLNENKLLNAVIAQIGMYDKEIKTFEFTTKQLQELCNLKSNHIKRTLNEIRKNLMNKTFSLKDEFEKDGKKEPATVEYHWIRYIKYNDNRWIIRLSDDLVPLLLNLKKEFTTKRLKQIQTYENIYAQRLDMIFTMYFNRKSSKMSEEAKKNYEVKISYTLEEIRNMFCLQEKYTEFQNFNRFILKPAVEEINKKGFFKVIMEKKIGMRNKCKEIIFIFSLGENNELSQEKTDEDKIKKLLKLFSYSTKEIVSILENISIKEIKNIFGELSKEKDTLTDSEQTNFIKEKISALLNKKEKEKLLKAIL